MVKSYGSSFRKVLVEQDLEGREDAAMNATLDDGTDPAAFDVHAKVSVANDQLKQAMNSRETEIVNTVRGWVEELDEFLTFLNGEEQFSIQSTLANAEPDTLLDKMKSSEQRKIARVATEIAALNESFRGYVAQAGNTALKYV